MNDFILIVLRSRTQAFNLKKIFIENKIPCEITTTPKEIAIGCGISLKIEKSYFEYAKKICLNQNQQSLVGFYKVNFDGFKNTILSLL